MNMAARLLLSALEHSCNAELLRAEESREACGRVHTSSQGQKLVLQDIPGVCALIHQVQLGDDTDGP